MTVGRSLKEYSYVIVLLVGGALAVGFGIWLAWSYGDAHWVNRAGAAVLCVEALLIPLEFARRARLSKLEGTNNYAAMRRLMERRDKIFMYVAVGLALLGEGLHGFGDLGIEAAFPARFETHIVADAGAEETEPSPAAPPASEAPPPPAEHG